MTVTLRAALPHEAPALSAMAVQAKRHWGYTTTQIARWQPEFLTITPDYIAANQVWVAVADAAALAGFAAIRQAGDEAELDHLWVLPNYMGRGIGWGLFRHVAAHVPDFVFTSDPHADAFYSRMGAHQIGEQYSVLQQTTLTRFRYTASVSG
jgi:GNAT superfamily N-acetyltransferase